MNMPPSSSGALTPITPLDFPTLLQNAASADPQTDCFTTQALELSHSSRILQGPPGTSNATTVLWKTLDIAVKRDAYANHLCC